MSRPAVGLNGSSETVPSNRIGKHAARLLLLLLCAALVLWWLREASSRKINQLEASLPMGAVDQFREERMAPVSGRVPLDGWVLSGDWVDSVVLYVDGRYCTSALLRQARPAITQQYPAYMDPAPGWSIEFDADAFPAGEHELVVQARTPRNMTRDLGRARVLFGSVSAR
jgi:hypothetical protein